MTKNGIFARAMYKFLQETGFLALRVKENWKCKKTVTYVVPEKTKISSEVFIKSTPKPMITKDIPRLFGDKKQKVIFHMDSAPSHRAIKTPGGFRPPQNHMYSIPAKEWMPYSPDMAPMDYAINGNLNVGGSEGVSDKIFLVFRNRAVGM